MRTIFVFAVSLACVAVCNAQYSYTGYGASYPGYGFAAAPVGGCGCGSCGFGAGCGLNGLNKLGGCGCGANIQCDPCLKSAIMSPLSGPGSPFCGACCDPIAACLFKKMRNYALDKKKLLADVIIKKNIEASKLLCGC